MVMARFSSFRWVERLRALRNDITGGVALIFAAAGMVLSLITAGGIEIHRRNLAITELQNAADSAALAAKLEQAANIGKDGKENARKKGKQRGELAFAAALSKGKNFKKAKQPAPKVTWDDKDDSATVTVTVTASQEYDLIFSGLIPDSFAKITVTATANFAQGIPTEVALVLDNTASMFNLDGRPTTRFTQMRDAAKKFTHQLFNAANGGGTNDLLRISVIPWATSVNVNGAAPAAADFSGDTAVFSIKDKGSELAVTKPINRNGSDVSVTASLFDPVTWRGCIKGENEDISTFTDSKPGTKWTALNVPETKSGDVTIAEGPLKTYTYNSCSCTAYGDDGRSNCGGGGGGNGPQGFNRLIERAVPQISNASLLFNRDLKDAGNAPVDRSCSVCVSESCSLATATDPDCSGKPYKTYRYCYAWNDNGRMNAYTSVLKPTCTEEWRACIEQGKGGPPLKSVAACVADPNEQAWIKGSVPWCDNYGDQGSKDWNSKHWNTDVVYYPIGGPNLNCPAPMLGLSGNRKQVLEYLDRMYPVPGGTHADVGLRWGLRSMSPNNNWPSFFGLTTKPGGFNGESKKVMILLTDGENEQAIDFPGYWGCKGKYGTDPSQPDCKGSPDATELDTRMQSWCTAIRDTYKISLYAISINVAGNAAKNKLVQCTGDASKVFTVDASDLTNVLTYIGGQIMKMRLTK